MERKYILGMILIVILILAGIFAYFSLNGTFSSPTITTPENYTVTNQGNNKISITNGETNYTVQEMVGEKSIDSCFNDCFNKHNDSSRVVNDTMKIDDIPVKTLTYKNNNNKTVHTYYFYQKGEKIYQLFAKGKYDKDTVELLINSTK
ncbi:MAG: hypothetical protein E7Z85_04170 [Methanosphaera stadtmanae]|nr:hypothetical protein [Methanosphaera stadtmanae]